MEGSTDMMHFKLYYHEFPECLHDCARAFVLKQDGYAMIVIDSQLPKDQQEMSLKHELAHLSLNHLIRPLPKDADPECGYIESEAWEAEANKYAEAMTKEEYEALMQWVI